VERKSKYRGVRRRNSRWVAESGVPSGTRASGSAPSPTPEDAALAYDRAARKLQGPHAYTNFPERPCLETGPNHSFALNSYLSGKVQCNRESFCQNCAYFKCNYS